MPFLPTERIHCPTGTYPTPSNGAFALPCSYGSPTVFLRPYPGIAQNMGKPTMLCYYTKKSPQNQAMICVPLVILPTCLHSANQFNVEKCREKGQIPPLYHQNCAEKCTPLDCCRFLWQNSPKFHANFVTTMCGMLCA